MLNNPLSTEFSISHLIEKIDLIGSPMNRLFNPSEHIDELKSIVARLYSNLRETETQRDDFHIVANELADRVCEQDTIIEHLNHKLQFHN